MKNKKVISIILSLSAVFSAFGAVPASAESDFSIATGYEFVDIAHKGDTYVAMAKDNTKWTTAKLYTSKDSGKTWTSTRSISSALVSANPQSQQQLLYWEDKGIFVAHCAGATLTSTDGSTWSNTTTLHNSANDVITTSGDSYIISGTNYIVATNDIENNKVGSAYQHSTLDVSASYPKVVAAKPADSEGNIPVLIFNQNKLLEATISKTEEGYSYTHSTITNNNAIPKESVDMVYASGADQYLAVSGAATLFTVKGSTSYNAVKVSGASTVTAVAASDKYIAVGTGDGKIYYTANAEITAETSWREIRYSGTTAQSEPIKNIEFADDGKSFVALSKTQIYKGNLSKFTNIDEYVEEYLSIADPVITGEEEANPFDGVRLIGGAYSDTLGKYVVYGDTVSKISVNGDVAKYWGMIYTSTDGKTWEHVYQGYTFSKHNDNGSFAEVRNGAVWWGAQNQFIISASTQEHSGVSLVSADGTKRTWSEAKQAVTGFGLNTDIAIGGNNLYTTDNKRQFRTYTAWNKDDMTPTDVTKAGTSDVPSTWYMNQIAVSDDSTNPAVLMAQSANGVVRNNDSNATAESDKWTLINTLGGEGALTDAVYSDKLGKFVAVLNKGFRTSIVSKDGSVVQGPVVAGGVCNAIDTNGEVFMFAGKDGNVYTAPDTANFSKGNTTLTAVPSANGNVNTMNVTNVFKAGDKFIATASDNTKSDVLVISKNSSGTYEYVTASSFLSKGSLVPGGSADVSVDVKNQMPSECKFTIIAAIYNADGALEQVKTEEKTVATFTNTTETMTVNVDSDIPTGSYMLAFVWNATDGMKALTKVSNPFN